MLHNLEVLLDKCIHSELMNIKIKKTLSIAVFSHLFLNLQDLSQVFFNLLTYFYCYEYKSCFSLNIKLNVWFLILCFVA